MIAERVYSIITGSTDVTDLVASRVHHQNNDLEEWQFDVQLPLITFARLTTSYNKNTKKIEPRQITVWAKTAKAADELVEIVIPLFDQVVDDEFKYCKLRSTNTIYDRSQKAHWVAMTYDFITQFVVG